MSSIRFPSIASKVHRQSEIARAAGDVIFTPSRVHQIEENGIPFEIRFAPSLAKKPAKPSSGSTGIVTDSNPVKSETEKKQNVKDVFAPPYVPNLFVQESEAGTEEEDEDYVILLNKFCVVPRHFLLVTKEFQPQNSPPSPSDLLAAYSVIRELTTTSEPVLGFYNCGEDSGASQPHKHIQFLPLPNGKSPFSDLISKHDSKKNEVFTIPNLPFASFFHNLDSSMISISSSSSSASNYLTDIFLSLLDTAITHVRRISHSQEIKKSSTSPPPPEQQQQQQEQGKAKKLSYNLLLTSNYMNLIPRSKERYPLDDGRNENEDGLSVSINSLGFGGMMLTKTEEELEGVKRVGCLEILRGVGWDSKIVDGDGDNNGDGLGSYREADE